MKRLLLTLCFLLLTSPAWATNYYVTSGGNDGADGSVGTPWASLSHACGAVSGVGDIINVAAGSYTDNTQCVLAAGVKIHGASSATTLISTTGNPYIEATTTVPVVDGSNEISGIGFTGANTAIRSRGRSNQKIHDNTFTTFALWLYISGKPPVYTATCVGGEPTATHCDNDHTMSVPPGTTDWATGVELYNNTITNAKIDPNSLKGALIHDNTINNAAADKSGVGNTSYFWSGVNFYNNTIHMHQNASTVIAMEIWEIDDDTKFHDNVSDGWWSLLLNTHGVSTPYSYEIYNNDFSSNITRGNIAFTLEVSWFLTNVRIAGNYFANTGGAVTYDTAILIGGGNVVNGVTIANNVFYNLVGADIDITSLHGSHAANIDNIYIYNNVFENTGGSAALLIENDNAGGDIDGIIMRNNLCMNMNYTVDFWPWPPASTSGNFYDHNDISGATDHVRTARDNGSFTVGTNYALAPGILATGSRWTNWYKPSNAGSNMINVGVNVGLPFFGSVPDIGPFDWTVPSYNTKTQNVDSTSTTSGSFSVTVGAVTHPLLLVLVAKRTGASATVGISTMTYNGVSMTMKSPHIFSSAQYVVELWYLANPATGAHTLAWTAPDNAVTVFEAVTIADANQSTIFRDVAVCGSGNSTTPTVTVPSATTDLVVDVLLKSGDAGTLAPGAGQTLIADAAGSTQIRGGGSYESGAASTVMNWTITSQIWVQCAASVMPFVDATFHHHPIVLQ